MSTIEERLGHHFALLAPVPLEHLRSGLDVVARKGSVCFGSRSFEVFRKLDQLRKEEPIMTLIYPSHEDEGPKHNYEVSWLASYVGQKESSNGRPDDPTFRPPTTFDYPKDNAGYWSTFWFVRGLQELPVGKHVSIAKISKLTGGKFKAAPIRRPIIVEVPGPVTYEKLMAL